MRRSVAWVFNVMWVGHYTLVVAFLACVRVLCGATPRPCKAFCAWMSAANEVQVLSVIFVRLFFLVRVLHRRPPVRLTTPGAANSILGHTHRATIDPVRPTQQQRKTARFLLPPRER